MRDHANERGGVPIVPGGRLYPTYDLPKITRAVESARRIMLRYITTQED